MNIENEVAANVLTTAEHYATEGADELFLFDYSTDDYSKEELLRMAKEVAKAVDIPFILGLSVKRFEDVKKALYTGASYVMVKHSCVEDYNVIKEATDRFGKDKVLVEVDTIKQFRQEGFVKQLLECGVYGIMLKHLTMTSELAAEIASCPLPVMIRDSFTRNDLEDLASVDNVFAVSTNYFEKKDIMKAKYALKEKNIPVNTFESTVSFTDFKLNADGLIPVIVQDYKTSEVLMLAYMNEESFQLTVKTGKMTYFSRSRQQLWCKGETSGHFQYVKALNLDCDNDTILAKVKQVGAACHTGNRSCFYTEIVKREYDDTNPLTVFSQVYDVIMDRKMHPKEGSYTNYLFDKGIDKILKKCGEEATEIVIAAKNPDAEELKYEISDFLYHMMVLMAECGLDWNDVVKELAHRR
ncbi:bifunctional phosphoribosyl-AMP cyclohydrolase/phosphoribosyl-ATP diphosphatase HisIE [Anaerosporobacter faecicola]|uniref:bifunctional phosphoribosyl-AMP cyclohydrolase/phosphoribosyl-ATP diphosphatase HisIE n=1 Tax=Anaerosporobacter faecicola TaxID=2718714 RepID=UPI001EE5DD95|nr:bifunctional phosphoribosyl-AMP cyclohydrolase/phosphoribosyl-ATP diphosphatase HisIE [Anaerosporobacter faecicola]